MCAVATGMESSDTAKVSSSPTVSTDKIVPLLIFILGVFFKVSSPMFVGSRFIDLRI